MQMQNTLKLHEGRRKNFLLQTQSDRLQNKEIFHELTQQSWHVLENSEQLWGDGWAVLQSYQPTQWEGGKEESGHRGKENEREEEMSTKEMIKQKMEKVAKKVVEDAD